MITNYLLAIEAPENFDNAAGIYVPGDYEVYKAGGIKLPTYSGTNFNFQNATIGEIIGKLLPYIFVVAGLILLFVLIMGGLGLMTAAGNPDKMKAGYGKITAGLIGFGIIFIAYFVAQLVEVMFGIKIL